MSRLQVLADPYSVDFDVICYGDQKVFTAVNDTGLQEVCAV